MRFSNLILGLTLGGLAAGGALMGCGGGDGGSGGSGGSGPSSTGSNNSTSSTGTSTSLCAPTAACKAADKECIGLVDNSSAATAGLRMSQLSMTKPAALTKGIVKNVVAGGVLPNIPTCNLTGSATFNWLLQFDTANGKLKTGGAKPVSDPTKGYSFINESINGFAIAPVTFDVTPDADGKFSVTDGVDLLVPIFLDAGGTQAVILPLKKARLINGVLSKNGNCIGKYNADGLSPDTNCLGDDTTPTFITGASLDGFITLDDADTVVIDSLMETLCVLLSGDPSKYGDGGSPVQKCKRTNNVIDYKGDWCASSNSAATPGTCEDAVQLGADFAASSVLINP